MVDLEKKARCLLHVLLEAYDNRALDLVRRWVHNIG